MTEETTSGMDNLSVVMTTTPVTMLTGASGAASSKPRGAEFYFQCAVVCIAVIGTVTNGLILYALVASKQHKEKFLIFNQNALDFFSSLWLFVTYVVKLCNISLIGQSGFWLCALILSDNFVWIGQIGSKLNLGLVTVERYLTVVHRVWTKKMVKPWMVYAAGALAWVGSVAFCPAMIISTSVVVHGNCYSFVKWESRAAQLTFVLSSFLVLYVILLLIILYCYGRILAVIRKQTSVMAGHSQASGSNNTSHAAQSQHKLEVSVVKTMIIISAFFAVLNLPLELNFMIVNFNSAMVQTTAYYVSVFATFVFTCMNPFIYAIKFSPVKRVLRDLVPCKNRIAGNSTAGIT